MALCRRDVLLPLALLLVATSGMAQAAGPAADTDAMHGWTDAARDANAASVARTGLADVGLACRQRGRSGAGIRRQDAAVLGPPRLDSISPARSIDATAEVYVKRVPVVVMLTAARTAPVRTRRRADRAAG